MASEIEYMVSRDTLDPHFCISINKDKFDKLKENQIRLFSALELEIRYEMILSNYIAMEKGLFSMMIDRSMFVPKNLQYEIYDEFTKNKIQFNTLLSNLLTVAISYQDHVKENIQYLFDISDEQIKEIFYKPGYKFIKELRNYQQHQNVVQSAALPKLEMVGGDSHEILGNFPCYVNLPTGRKGKNKKNKNENVNLLSLIPPVLKSRLNEVNQLNIYGISKFCMDLHNEIHREISGIINPTVQEARNYIEEFNDDCISKVREKYPNIQDEENLNMEFATYAYTWKTKTESLLDQNINISKEVPLLPELGRIRDNLNKKNQKKFYLLNQEYRL